MPASPAPVGTAGRRSAKKDPIRQAAMRVFLRHGYAGTSIDAILAEAGVSRQTLYNHFGGKEGLFRAVVQDVLDEVLGALADQVEESALGESDDLETDLTRLGTTWARVMLQPHVLALRRLVIGESTTFPHLAQTWIERGPERLQQYLLRAFGRLADRGLLRLDDPQVTVTLYAHSMVLIPDQAMMRLGTTPDEATIDRYITAAVRMFLARYAATQN
ncbi:TetR/AcrR family transcriptional regulator [Streptomyces tubercidicus]|uniref:TetR/AcrR family transcriptional regulator n=1 Tax=Streptomyces tubercidicus TaxID=47759 RepID=UPI002E1331A0|nr:TetR/AcrR family transcriptional regulator [Streptomyces tubercidicus]WSX23748.1 TetR/AcrR family transcriptional regulator [Streptomyces tubercidicus]